VSSKGWPAAPTDPAQPGPRTHPPLRQHRVGTPLPLLTHKRALLLALPIRPSPLQYAVLHLLQLQAGERSFFSADILRHIICLQSYIFNTWRIQQTRKGHKWPSSSYIGWWIRVGHLLTKFGGPFLWGELSGQLEAARIQLRGAVGAADPRPWGHRTLWCLFVSIAAAPQKLSGPGRRKWMSSGWGGSGRAARFGDPRAEEGRQTAVRAIYCQMDSSRGSAQTGTAAGPPPLFSRPRRTAGSKPLHCPAVCEPVRSLDRGPCPEASHPLHSDQVQRGCCHRILQDTQSPSPQLPPPNGHEGIQKPRRISEYLTKRCIAYMWRVRS